MIATSSLRVKNPSHPGAFVKAEIIAPLGLSVTQAARVLGVTRPALSAFLNERSSLSPEMALRIEKAFCVRPHLPLRTSSNDDTGISSAPFNFALY